MSAWYDIYPTCRFCGECGPEDRFVKYGVRHYAHFSCYLDNGKPLAALHAWQINEFPWRLIKDRGLIKTVEALTKGKV